MIRQKVQQKLNGYLQVDQIIKDIDSYIVPGVHGNDAGIIGALALAEVALKVCFRHAGAPDLLTAYAHAISTLSVYTFVDFLLFI